MELAARVLNHPAGSLPEQTGNMADLKAAYRLFACEDNKGKLFVFVPEGHLIIAQQFTAGLGIT
ncbi:MAG: transposase DNA-binding-containing protein [Planctomycetota bacterium]